MNEDAFARRFYADRSELDSLGIALTVERPSTASPSRRTTRCARRTSTSRRSRSPTPSWPRCRRRSRCSTASSPTPSRCAWRCSRSPGAAPNPLRAPEQRARRAGDHGVRRRPRPLPAPGQDRDGDLPQQDDHVRLLHDGARRDGHAQGRPLPPALPGRPVLPARPLARARRAARLPAVAHPAARSPTRRRPSTTSRAAPEGFDPRAVRQPRRLAVRRRRRARPRSGSPSGSPGRSSATSAASARSSPRPARAGDIVFATPYADRRQLAAWVLRLGEHARVLGPPELERELAERVELLHERHRGAGAGSSPTAVAPAAAADAERRRGLRPTAASRRPRRRSAPSASRAS